MAKKTKSIDSILGEGIHMVNGELIVIEGRKLGLKRLPHDPSIDYSHPLYPTKTNGSEVASYSSRQQEFSQSSGDAYGRESIDLNCGNKAIMVLDTHPLDSLQIMPFGKYLPR